ncbi:hypothetical protein RhiirC2_306712 [Rhizophagus irregularis]|uniref:Uncharacterized protein n=1 Tax=Rhizophagus irregularis TaxID=588596 RepID=A0A2N1MBY9_9GLOM|nr:hypothetical protein RhiirC2_306712 [Rhizophagus irregularis]
MILRLPNEADDDFDKILMEIHENDDMYFDDPVPQTVISPPVTELLISFFEHVGGLDIIRYLYIRHVGGLDIMRRKTSFILLVTGSWSSPCPICDGKHGNYGLHGSWYCENGNQLPYDPELAKLLSQDKLEYCLTCFTSIDETDHLKMRSCNNDDVILILICATIDFLYNTGTFCKFFLFSELYNCRLHVCPTIF